MHIAKEYSDGEYSHADMEKIGAGVAVGTAAIGSVAALANALKKNRPKTIVKTVAPPPKKDNTNKILIAAGVGVVLIALTIVLTRKK
jgi:hypothetical protein